MEPTDSTYPIIRYIVMLGRRTKPNPIAVFPPVCMSHDLLQHISRIPHNLYHFLSGCDYFQRILLFGEQSGIQVDFIFNDTIENESFIMSLSKGLNIFLICTDNEEELIEMNISLSRICPKNCLFWVDNSVKNKFVMPRVITEQKEFWDYLFKYSLPLIKEVQDPLCVPLCAGSVHFPYFKPANITFYSLSSALGNWYVGNENIEAEVQTISAKTRSAISDKYGFDRQENTVDVIGQLYSLCYDAFKIAPIQKNGFSDQNLPPLVLTAPYTNKDVRNIIKQAAHNKEEFKYVDNIAELEQTPNYCYDINAESLAPNFQNINTFIKTFHANRIDFHDFVASLHCSFRFSPYLRLPIICKSINKELSHVSVKNNNQLAYSRNRMAYNTAIHNIGALLASKLIAPKTMKMLEKIPMQIVSITDLPIEWMEINGIPLAFMHDVCRIPETPASGILSHYEIARFASYHTISKDILSKTLVVYGCREEAFKEWQDKVDVLALDLGIKTAVCNNLDEFEVAVKRFKPEFLIIDTHGGVDMELHQGYILMGREKVYPKHIVERKICANLVFISACNTAPCYNDINTIGNALFEIGSAAVTASYLPLDVREASTLYIRILHQLKMAAQNNIHRNWLAFISHILRTSFIMAPMIKDDDKDVKCIDPMTIARVNTLTMIYENRVDIYKKLKNGEEVEGLKYDFSKVIPHYLMYTTIGRADLIQFESFVETRRKEYQKMIGRDKI